LSRFPPSATFSPGHKKSPESRKTTTAHKASRLAREYQLPVVSNGFRKNYFSANRKKKALAVGFVYRHGQGIKACSRLKGRLDLKAADIFRVKLLTYCNMA